jgi:hypothetical protein
LIRRRSRALMEHNSAAPEFKKSGLIGSGGKQSPAQYCAHQPVSITADMRSDRSNWNVSVNN